MTPIRMNLGCGYEQPEGWVNLDVLDYGQEHRYDVLAGLPFSRYTFDYIVAHHTLQMFNYTELPKVLAELRRILKPGRPLRVSVPDPIRAFEAYKSGNRQSLVIPSNVERTLGGAFSAYITWYGTNKTLFTFEFAKDLFLREGWSKVLQCGYQDSTTACEGIRDLDSRPKESLYFEAYK